MNEKRKQIIISEIKYWKQNKLLPEHYCDFLITLYAKGEESEQPEVKASQSVIVKEKNRLKQTVITLFLFVIFFSVFLLTFTTYPEVLLALSSVVFVAFLYGAIRGTRSRAAVTPFLYILSAYLFLAMSMKLWHSFFFNESIILIGLLTLNCIGWLFVGRLLKYHYFTISGAAGLLIIVGFLVKLF